MLQPSLINPEDRWIIWTFLVSWAALSIFLEQRYRWGERISGVVIALFGGLCMSNLGVLPTKSPVYDAVWDYIVPICIPLLLLQCDLRKIWRETGRLLGAFHISAAGTMIGAFVAVALTGSLIPYLPEVCGIMTASYIGGAMNFLAAVNVFSPPESISNALIVADNVVMALHIMAMLALPGLRIAVVWFGSLPDEALYDSRMQGDDKAPTFWRAKPISLVDIGKNLSLAFIIVTLGTKVSAFVESTSIGEPFRTLLGNKYLLFTSFTVLFGVLFPGVSKRLRGTQEMGTFAIFLFFVLIGIPASIRSILMEAPSLFVLCLIMVLSNIVITFGVGKIFRFTIQEMILVSIANTAGPMNAAAIAISKRWTRLILPSFLVGIWGYVIGTYLGVLVGRFLQSL